MCLQTTWKKPKIAKRNRIVYKELKECEDNNGEKRFTSVFQEFPYEIGKLYTTELKETDDDGAYDQEATEARVEHKGDFLSISEGFHAAIKKKRLNKEGYDNDRVLVKCIIPKGAKYYTGFTGLIVSNKIKIVGKV